MSEWTLRASILQASILQASAQQVRSLPVKIERAGRGLEAGSVVCGVSINYSAHTGPVAINEQL